MGQVTIDPFVPGWPTHPPLFYCKRFIMNRIKSGVCDIIQEGGQYLSLQSSLHVKDEHVKLYWINLQLFSKPYSSEKLKAEFIHCSNSIENKYLLIDINEMNLYFHPIPTFYMLLPETEIEYHCKLNLH